MDDLVGRPPIKPHQPPARAAMRPSTRPRRLGRHRPPNPVGDGHRVPARVPRSPGPALPNAAAGCLSISWRCPYAHCRVSPRGRVKSCSGRVQIAMSGRPDDREDAADRRERVHRVARSGGWVDPHPGRIPPSRLIAIRQPGGPVARIEGISRPRTIVPYAERQVRSTQQLDDRAPTGTSTKGTYVGLNTQVMASEARRCPPS
jgi:hypothetical protein